MVSSAAPMRDRMTDYINKLQETIVSKLETYCPGKTFRREPWTQSEGGGGGLSCTFASSIAHHPIEKAAVNVSAIHGVLPPAAIKHMSTAHAALKHIDTSLPYFAAGLSLVIHPRHPRVPAVHTNYRYFQVLDNDRTVLAWWFGVTTDMTPAYVNGADFRHFHTALKTVCDTWSDTPHTAISIYPPFKTSCDDYLFIPHRHEHRGIGGIRFDDLDSDAMRALLSAQPGVSDALIARLSDEESLFGLVTSLGDSFLPCFVDILERRMDEPLVPSEKRWQLLRRGRSVEFTLVSERGTQFGLAAPGVKVENVLASMPPEARWEYCCELGVEDRDTEEAKVTKILKKPRDWTDWGQ